MKTEALTYTLLAIGLAALTVLLLSLPVNLADVDLLLGWSTVAVLLAMAPLDYRNAWKRITGR